MKKGVEEEEAENGSKCGKEGKGKRRWRMGKRCKDWRRRKGETIEEGGGMRTGRG